MNGISPKDKLLAEQMTKEFASRSKVHPTKGKYIFNQKQPTFASVNFSGYVEDAGNPSADFAETDFSRDEENCYPELNPVEVCKRIVFNAEAKAQAETWVQRRNKQIRAAKEAMQKRFNN